MAAEKVLIIDGTTDGAGAPASILDALTGVLAQRRADVRLISGDGLKVTNCIGCFGCWLETPGLCRFKEPAGRELLEGWAQSDTVILLTPVTFGGYSSRLKQVMDRSIPILLPYMAVQHGEVHHRPRYAKMPRLVAIGIQEAPDPAQADTFRLLAGRHAVDCWAPSYAAEVVGAGDGQEQLSTSFRSILSRNDVFPRGKAVQGAAPAGPVASAPAIDWSGSGEGRRACLIVGSPKTQSRSTSGVVGNYVLDHLRECGWETEARTLKAASFTAEGESDLLAAVDRADLLLFAFPLYVDALPALLTRAVERIAAHRAGAFGQATGGARRPLGLSVLINNGFPESFQNNVALSICKNFADAAGMVWLGGLAMGAGESVVGGEPLKAKSGSGLPTFKVHAALQAVAESLDRGRPVPAEVTAALATGPIPHVPFAAWRLMFLLGSKAFWEKRAASFGVEKKSLLARPFAAGAAAWRRGDGKAGEVAAATRAATPRT